MPARPRVDRIKTIYTAAKALNYSWRLSDFLKTPLQNGVCSYICQLHRITIRFCKQSESSSGIRNYIEHMLPRFAHENPSVVVYVLPARNTTPTLRAEYANGRLAHINVTNFGAEKFSKYMNLLRTRSGLPIVHLESPQSAAINSVQGVWNPMYNLDSEQNLPEWPKEKFSQNRPTLPTATEYVASLLQKQE